MNYLHPSEIERLSHLSNHPFDEIRADSLTPSDHILLGEARWIARHDPLQLWEMAHGPGLDALVRAVATAFLVNERAGNISLELARSRYAGFNRFVHVESTFVRRRHHWPADSLEAQLSVSGKVLDLVSSLVDRDSGFRPALTRRLLQQMSQRGLMRHEVQRHRRLVLMRRAHERYVIGPRVHGALQEETATAAARFIPLSSQSRPELTTELLNDVRAVLSR